MYLARQRSPFMITNSAGVVSNQHRRKYKESISTQPPKSKAEVRSFLAMSVYLSKFIPLYASLTKPLRELTHKDSKFHLGPEEGNALNKDTMVILNLMLSIMVRVESPGLFQQSTKGWQPVLLIIRRLTDVEKRYTGRALYPLSSRRARLFS